MKKFKSIWRIFFVMPVIFSCSSKSDKAAEDALAEQEEVVVAEKIKFQYEMEDEAYPDAILELYSPLENQTFKEGKVPFEFNIKNYPFGELIKGGMLKMIINGGEPVGYNMPIFSKTLKTGTYKILAYLVDENGMALKEYGNYVDRNFVVGDSRPFPENEGPVIGLNLPYDGQEFQSGESVPVDFLLVGGELKKGGLQIKVTVDDQEYIIQNTGKLAVNDLSVGEHLVTVELIDQTGNELPGIFTKSIRKITVKN